MARQIKVTLRGQPKKEYSIRFSGSLRDSAGVITRTVNSPRYFIIADRTVGSLYGNELLRSFKSHRKSAFLLTFPPGEQYKSRSTKGGLEDRILSLGADRESVIVALGGGVTGDLAGFVAATLLRGIRYVQIPTSLVGQVDSSVGGKVGVDHPAGKNLVGAFYQPEAVFIILRTLRTLPEIEFRNGIAEIIKYGAICDKRLLAYVERNMNLIQKRMSRALLHVVSECCRIKSQIVGQDERDGSIRRLLNFGHTIGHAIEHATHYKVGHGHAVAIGMSCEARIAVSLGLLTRKELGRLVMIIDKFGLPTRIPRGVGMARLIKLTTTDKKSLGGSVRYALPDGLGRGRVDISLTESEVLRLMTE